jgi:hypothetical protein
MNQAILSGNSISVETVEAGGRSREAAGSRPAYARLIGALFLAGFLLYGIGYSLVTSVTGAPGFLATISAHQTTLVLGAFLMLLNTVADVGKGVLFFPILEKHGQRTALAYLAAMIVEVVLLDIGALCLLMIVPMGQYAVAAGGANAAWATALGSLLSQSNTMAYQIGEMTLGLGALFLCALLFRTRLIPRWLSIAGLVGYMFLTAGCIAEVFGIHIGLYCTLPGMFFELVLPCWLFIKGFQPEADGQVSWRPGCLEAGQRLGPALKFHRPGQFQRKND